MISAAHKKALAAPDPDPASILNFVTAEPYKSEKYPEGIPDGSGPKRKLIEALNETLKAEFRLNPDTFMWGQDMASGEKGGIFNVSKGMQKEFGVKRIFNAPIAEDYIVGTANGMSRFREKIQIVIEGAEFADYFWPAMEQLVEMSHDYLAQQWPIHCKRHHTTCLWRIYRRRTLSFPDHRKRIVDPAGTADRLSRHLLMMLQVCFEPAFVPKARQFFLSQKHYIMILQPLHLSLMTSKFPLEKQGSAAPVTAFP